jgi:hypothetical protein
MPSALLAGAPIWVAREVLDAGKAEGKGSWRVFEAEQDTYSQLRPQIVSTTRSEWDIAIAQLRDRP